ncbi:MAG: DNA repair protein RadC [Anaerolineae bacterium]|nr:DNA repair protein RadC [Anaerolineae bacterium]
MIIRLHEQKNVIASPKDVYAILRAVLSAEDEVDRDKEHFWVFQLDTRLRIKVLELVTLGILNASLVHPREVFTRAITNRAHAILIAHNHPSGQINPSGEDLDLTQQLVKAGKILGIELVDHIIIGESDYLSMKQSGLL